LSASQSMPKRRAIIHIGAPKTGTTSIQEYLNLNRHEMQQLRFAYPRAPGQRTHIFLAAAIAEAARTGSMTSLDLLRKNLAAEIAALPETVHTVIFSSEHLSVKIASDEDARRLRQFLDSWFESYRIVLYMRRQDERAVSDYSTQLRTGRNAESVLPNKKFRRDDYLPILERYSAAFGQDTLAPRLFVRDAFKDGDLLTDFREVAGLPELPNMLPKVLNFSFSATAQELMRRLNAMRGGNEEHDKVPTRVRDILRRYSGPGRRPSRKEAMEYYEAFSASNEKIRATWFSDRATLFPEDFSRYPEEGDPLPTDKELLEVALTVISEQASGERSAKNLLRRADNAAKNGSKRDARRFVERLLDTAPGNLDALTRLVDLVDGPRSGRAAAARVSNAYEADPQSEAISALFARLDSRSGEEGRTKEERAERRARRLRRHREEVRGKKSEGGEASARSAL
jgi:hypothetical protein